MTRLISLALAGAIVLFVAPGDALSLKLCRDRVYASYFHAMGKSSARSGARTNWADSVRRSTGQEYSDWRLAKTKAISCFKCGKKKGASTNCAGKRFGWVCGARAYPCKKAR